LGYSPEELHAMVDLQPHGGGPQTPPAGLSSHSDHMVGHGIKKEND